MNVAVTGHRDLVESQFPAIRKVLSDWFLILHSEAKVTLLTGMAPGADSLVAAIVLDLSKQHPTRFAIQPVLPFPQHHFLNSTTFDSDQQRHSFIELVKEIEGVCGTKPIVVSVNKTIRVADSELGTIVSGDTGRSARREYYAALGAYLAIHSDILLALLDPNEDQQKRGGTESVVQIKRGEVSSDLLDQPIAMRSRAVVHLPVRRKKLEGKGLSYPELKLGNI